MMDSEESSRRLRHALRAELKKHWGQVGDIHSAIGMSSAYLSKVCRGEEPIPLDRLLLLLEVMGTDIGRFFANALNTRVDNDSLLEDLERFGKIHPRLRVIEKATAKIELSEQLEATAPRTSAGEMFQAIVACSGKEQRRRLSNSKKYRHPAFVAAYLDHLDDLRYDNPKEARQNAETLAVRLIPTLKAPRSECLILQLKAIGIYASAHRQAGQFAMAASALRRALAVARTHGLKPTVADLLQRAAYVLSDHGRYSDALELLNEALLIFFDLRSGADLARTQVDRGVQLHYLGQYREAVDELERALEGLKGSSPCASRNRLVAYQTIARCLYQLGDMEHAEKAASQAVACSEKAGSIYQSFLLWDHGAIALKCGEYTLAEQQLREATQLLTQAQDPNKALVALDLTKTLIAQGKNLEATAVATTAAEYLSTFRGNRITAAVVSDLMGRVFQSGISIDIIESVQEKLKSAGDIFARRKS